MADLPEVGVTPTDYRVQYITCRVCGANHMRVLGIRGNQEYYGAPPLGLGEPHMITNVVRCKGCDFVYTNPFIVLSDHQKRRFYHSPEDYLSSQACSFDPFRYSLTCIEQLVAEKGRLLDVGCGKGEFLHLAKKNGWDGIGIEASIELAQYARQTYGIQVLEGNLEDIDFDDNLFDAVTLNMVLEHIDYPNSLLKEIDRILKPNGLVFVEVPNVRSFLLSMITIYYRLKGLDWSPLLSPLHWPHHCYGYSRRSLRVLFEQNGFQPVRINTIDLVFRGFRQNQVDGLKRIIRDGAMKFGRLIGMGDVLILIARKR